MLLVYVDDATGKLMSLRMCESESAFSYFHATRSYLGRHGKPAAKGRVERAHQTLQDRLVKELRLRGISSMDDANRYLTEIRKAQQERKQELVQSAKSKREKRIVRDRFAGRLPPPSP